MKDSWQDLRNPVIAAPGGSIKDACLVYHNGQWHCFASVFDEERSSVTAFHSDNLLNWSDMDWRWDGRDEGWLGLCSPHVMRDGDDWLMTLNSWGDATVKPNRLFYRRSPDLMTWGPMHPLAHALTLPAGAAIDAALAHHGEHWFLACNLHPGKRTRLATAGSLDGPWTWLSEAPPLLAVVDGRENGLHHENYQFIRIDGVWHLLCTDHPPLHAWLYQLAGDPAEPGSWLNWINGRQLAVPVETWNQHHHDNAAALWDHREMDGWFYLVYAGQGLERADEFRGTACRYPKARGWNRLGVARSRDLLKWEVPGCTR